MQTDQLSAVFGALSDPTRRAILASLVGGERTVAELGAPFAISQPAVSKHLRVLEQAGLITRSRRATARLSRLRAEPLQVATTWLLGYREYWEESYERLDELLVALQHTEPGEPPPADTQEGRVPVTTATMRLVAEPGTTLIETERELAAPRDLVYRAWTDPALLAQWLGPRRLTMRVETFDLRHGGAWRYVNVDTDGTEYGFHGVFHGDPTPDRLVQTFEFEGAPGHVALDTVVFEDRGPRTLVRSVSAYQSVEDRNAMVENGMAVGMEDGYAKLDELLARLQA